MNCIHILAVLVLFFLQYRFCVALCDCGGCGNPNAGTCYACVNATPSGSCEFSGCKYNDFVYGICEDCCKTATSTYMPTPNGTAIGNASTPLTTSTKPSTAVAVSTMSPSIKKPLPTTNPTKPSPSTTTNPTKPSPSTTTNPTKPSPSTTTNPTKPSPSTTTNPTKPPPTSSATVPLPTTSTTAPPPTTSSTAPPPTTSTTAPPPTTSSTAPPPTTSTTAPPPTTSTTTPPPTTSSTAPPPTTSTTAPPPTTSTTTPLPTTSTTAPPPTTSTTIPPPTTSTTAPPSTTTTTKPSSPALTTLSTPPPTTATTSVLVTVSTTSSRPNGPKSSSTLLTTTKTSLTTVSSIRPSSTISTANSSTTSISSIYSSTSSTSTSAANSGPAAAGGLPTWATVLLVLIFVSAFVGAAVLGIRNRQWIQTKVAEFRNQRKNVTQIPPFPTVSSKPELAVNGQATIHSSNKSRKIFLKHYNERVAAMKDDGKFSFESEYQTLKRTDSEVNNINTMITVGKLPQNMAKNRYVDIVPYDHNLVTLDTGSYINANYIQGYSRPREYISTQGPIGMDEQMQGRRLATIADFWQMVWQDNSSTIVMLTKCVELFKRKCSMYWPQTDNETEKYGDFTVKLVSERDCGGFYVMRVLEINLDGECRRVHQWQCVDWPDMQRAQEENLLLFIHSVRKSISSDSPLIVHCSAGVGRSGCFIALDLLLQSIADNDYVDIFDCVLALRGQRVHMVQTVEQYMLLYDCLDLAVSQKLLREKQVSDEDGLTHVYENLQHYLDSREELEEV